MYVSNRLAICDDTKLLPLPDHKVHTEPCVGSAQYLSSPKRVEASLHTTFLVRSCKRG